MALTSNAGALSKPGRYLREHRYRLTLWTAAIEGLLVFVHVIPHLMMYVLAVVAILFWLSTARKYQSFTARQLSWVFAASQSLAVLVLIVLFIAKAVAITLIAIFAVIALIVLFAERERT